MELTKTVINYQIRPGAYYDSIVLMQLRVDLVSLNGVEDAGVIMASATNQDLLAESGLLPAGVKAGPDDLLVVVKAESEEAAGAAIKRIDEFLDRRRSSSEYEYRARSLDTALKLLPQAQWVVISVPGKYAAGIARQAIHFNRHVFLYSDNVALVDEVELKQAALAKGLLVMGPDCGTAMINGVGLGFANRVRRGQIGLVGASGTGIQAISVHIHALGGGVSHAIGTGGRDLSAEVMAVTARQGLDLLGRDEKTKVILLVSKPPDPAVATRLLARAQSIGKTVVVYFSGYPTPARRLGQLHFASTMLEAAELAVNLAGQENLPTSIPIMPGNRRYLRGLFSGGTLAYEALVGLKATFSPLYANIAMHPAQQIPDVSRSQKHTLLDLGADEFTIGRLHPMIDNDLRLRRLQQEAADPEVGMIMMDVVLGGGAHTDPASQLAPAIAKIKLEHEIDVIAILIGTDDDPQDASVQAKHLEEAGARVFRSTAEAVVYIHTRLQPEEVEDHPRVPLEILQNPLAAVNLGLETFYESLLRQGAQAVQVDWRPPAGGDERMMEILAKLKS